ncbi:MAG: DUF169 domain-containing protein [Candidatus Hodarchaeota archaeon]
MAELSPIEIGRKLTQAGRLNTHPLCIYGADTPPVDSIPSNNRCIANVIYSLATNSIYPSVHIGRDEKKECCPGGQAWFGFKPFIPHLKYFLSTGSQDFRNGKSEFLISDPELAQRRLQSTGNITPLGRYIVIHRSDQIIRGKSEIKAFLCFGSSEQVRNLCSLAYFHSEKSIGVQIPWGPSCASFVSYPAGLVENGPKDCVIVGPTDPTGNYWFPENFMSVGIPFNIAKQMAVDVDFSFIGKRPKIAYPRRKE